MTTSVRISELPALSSPDGSTLFVVVAGDVTYQMTLTELYDFLRTNLSVIGPLILTDGNLVLPRTAGIGIKLDSFAGNPSFGWRDLEGALVPKATGAGSPTLTTFQGQRRWFAYANGDDMDCMFHVPHDWVPGSDLYLHLHWAHNGTNISGSSVINYYVSYGKGHNQAPFVPEANITQTIAGLNITNTPQYQTRIDEFVITTNGGGASSIDINQIEPDGLIHVHFDWTTIPTITGGAAKPFAFYLDLHYQSSNIGTKNKAPNFYS